jgi:hypothetical protein
MAVESGLFDARREFLLSVNYAAGTCEPEWAWVRVRLSQEWDIAGSEARPLRSAMATLFTTRFVPEFTALSLDQHVLMNTTVWGNGTISTIVTRPLQPGTLRAPVVRGCEVAAVWSPTTPRPTQQSLAGPLPTETT